MQVGGWLRVGIRLMKSGGNCKLATEPNKWLLWRQCEDTQAAAALAACGRGSGSGSRRGRHLRDLHDVSVVVAPRCGDVCNVDHAGPAGRDTGPGEGKPASASAVVVGLTGSWVFYQRRQVCGRQSGRRSTAKVRRRKSQARGCNTNKGCRPGTHVVSLNRLTVSTSSADSCEMSGSGVCTWARAAKGGGGEVRG